MSPKCVKKLSSSSQCAMYDWLAHDLKGKVFTLGLWSKSQYAVIL
jgi:hypothetical protein